MINGAICNAQDTSGCSQPPASTPAGFGATDLVIDQTTNEVYVTNDQDTSVSVTNGNTCNGSGTTGCIQTPTKIAVGNYPVSIAVDASVGSAYITDLDHTVSVIALTRSRKRGPARRTGRVELRS